ncbi:MAG: hypothetical protein AB7O26_05855 [Planctomycetaceae bacterium]
MQLEIPEVSDNNIRQMQIVVFALLCGVVMFGLITMFLTWGQAPGDALVAYIAAGFGAFAIPMSFILLVVVANGAVKSVLAEARNNDYREMVASVDKLAIAYKTKLIISVAVLEGAAMFNLVAYLLERQAASLLFAGVLAVIMALLFPTPVGVQDWVQRRFNELQFS